MFEAFTKTTTNILVMIVAGILILSFFAIFITQNDQQQYCTTSECAQSTQENLLFNTTTAHTTHTPIYSITTFVCAQTTCFGTYSQGQSIPQNNFSINKKTGLITYVG
jgi:hypothetical protein